ncbi:MAG TPA: cytochrome c oxidase subunit II [Acidimicrobiales bacterium]|nr:cytochrome c oxidase subunit II [Acidimicrobiales bacterium]
MHRPWRSLAPLLLACLLAGACGADGPSFGAPRGATRQGREIFRLWQGSVWAALAVGALVWGLIFFVVLRYRRRGDRLPAQTQANIPLEVLYTATPLAVVAVLFAFNVRTLDRVDALSAHPAVTVEVTGFQWQWRFRYPREGVEVIGTNTKEPVMVVPVHATVRLILKSDDVQHSFFVPAFLFKRDAVPGLTNQVDLFVEKVGRYDGRCAEFCGLLHDRMRFVVEAVPPEQFRQWVTRQQPQPTGPPRAGAPGGQIP